MRLREVEVAYPGAKYLEVGHGQYSHGYYQFNRRIMLNPVNEKDWRLIIVLDNKQRKVHVIASVGEIARVFRSYYKEAGR